MSDQERVEIIVALRRRRWTYKRIGQEIGMSANGVKYALHRVTQPGRHVEVDPEEVE
jgi:lambda repressor-like predicted transcriptional regulator